MTLSYCPFCGWATVIQDEGFCGGCGQWLDSNRLNYHVEAIKQVYTLDEIIQDTKETCEWGLDMVKQNREFDAREAFTNSIAAISLWNEAYNYVNLGWPTDLPADTIKLIRETIDLYKQLADGLAKMWEAENDIKEKTTWASRLITGLRSSVKRTG